VGTHGVRHRAATEIANSGVPVKVGMQLTAHKTVTQFMRYINTEDEQVRAAAEGVATRRRALLCSQSGSPVPAFGQVEQNQRDLVGMAESKSA
jgi:hypothetical protein